MSKWQSCDPLISTISTNANQGLTKSNMAYCVIVPRKKTKYEGFTQEELTVLAGCYHQRYHHAVWTLYMSGQHFCLSSKMPMSQKNLKWQCNHCYNEAKHHYKENMLQSVLSYFHSTCRLEMKNPTASLRNLTFMLGITFINVNLIFVFASIIYSWWVTGR